MTRTLVAALAISIGCGPGSTPSVQGPEPVTGHNVIDALHKLTVENGEVVKGRSVYVEVTESTGVNTGVAVVIDSANGYLLMPIFMAKKNVDKIRIWIEGDEFSARFLFSDNENGLGLSLLKVEESARELLQALDYHNSPFANQGQYLFAYTPTGAQTNFETFAFHSQVRGTIMSVYDQLHMGQTNAAIGTPLLDTKGAWVGLMAGSRYRGSVYLVRDLEDRIDTLIQKAEDPDKYEEIEKRKPWIGIRTEVINEDYAKYKDLPKSGIWVRAVYRDSPAERAGLKPDDLIVAIDDRDIKGRGNVAWSQFRKLMRPKDGVKRNIKVIRDGTKQTLTAIYEKRPEEKSFKDGKIGLTVSAITDMAYQDKNLETRQGVLISDIERGSPAATSRTFGASLFQRGQVIVAVNGKPVPDLATFKALIREVRERNDEVVLFKLMSGRFTFFESVNLSLATEAEE